MVSRSDAESPAGYQVAAHVLSEPVAQSSSSDLAEASMRHPALALLAAAGRHRSAFAAAAAGDDADRPAAHERRRHPAHRSAGRRRQDRAVVAARADDPATARQRALEVKAEAQQVSERIQRMLDQQRRADEESERTRLARMRDGAARPSLRRSALVCPVRRGLSPVELASELALRRPRPLRWPWPRQSAASGAAQERPRGIDVRASLTAPLGFARPAMLCRRRPRRALRLPC